MTRIVAKISLYDILAMIVPGSIFLMGLGMFDDICNKVQDLSFIEYFGMDGHAFWTITGTIFFLTLSYVIGIMIQAINVEVIKRLYKTWNEDYIDDYISGINEDRQELYELVKPVLEIKEPKKRKDAAKRVYYEAYNCAITYNEHTAVLDLEKQIAMLRNFAFAVLPLCIAVFTPICLCGFVLWLLVCALLLVVISYRMEKAVELVFEEYEAVKQLGLDKKKD